MGKKYSVYKHTAPNGKSYIGITSTSLSRRSGNGSGYFHNDHFTSAIKKYGWENFSHEIIVCGLTADEAEKKERELIAELKTNDARFGYNLTDGGEKGKHHSEVSKAKMSTSKKGMYVGLFNPRFGATCSDETKKKISEALKGKMIGEKNPNYGKKMSEEQKELIRKGRTGKHFPKLSESLKTSQACIDVRERQKKPVSQFTKDGVFIKQWSSAADASCALIGHRRGQSNICSCANGKLGSAYGFVWKHDL